MAITHKKAFGWRNLCVALVSAPLLTMAGSAGAATGSIINGATATLNPSTGTTQRIIAGDTFGGFTKVTEGAGITDVTWTVTPTNRTVWYAMNPTLGPNPHEDFIFRINTSGTSFTDLWIDVWKPGGSVEGVFNPPAIADPNWHTTNFGIVDDNVWGKRTSYPNWLDGGTGPVGGSFSSAEPSNTTPTERETIRLQVDPNNPVITLRDGENMLINTSFEAGDFEPFPDATWNNFNDFGSFAPPPSSPIWFLGLTVDGPGALITEQDLVDLGYAAVPIPAAFWMFGSALLGLVTVGRRRMAGARVTRG